MKDLVISIRNYNENNYKQIIDAIKNAGFKNVFIEWYNDNLKLQNDILNYVKENNLNIVFAHLGYRIANDIWHDNGNGVVNKYINDIKICKENGIELVIMHPTLVYEDPGMNELGLNRIKEILDYAKNINVKVAFENVELVEYLEYIIKNIDYPNLGVCYDVGHANLFCNGNFNVELFKDRVFAIHLHDNFKKKDDHNLPFDGTVNFEDAIKKIKDMNYNGYVIIESGYSNYYNNLSIEDYYKLAYERGLKVNEMFSKEVNK